MKQRVIERQKTIDIQVRPKNDSFEIEGYNTPEEDCNVSDNEEEKT